MVALVSPGRRGQIRDEYRNLQMVLPFGKLDQVRVLQLSVYFLRMKHLCAKMLRNRMRPSVWDRPRQPSFAVDALLNQYDGGGYISPHGGGEHAAIGSRTEGSNPSIRLPKHLEEGDLMLEALGGFVIFVCRRGFINFVSPHVQDVLGTKAENLIGESIYDVIPRDDHVVFRKQFSSTKQSHRLFYVRMNCDPRDSRRPRSIFVQWSGRLLLLPRGGEGQSDSPNGGSVRGLVAICRPTQCGILELGARTPRCFTTYHDMGMRFTYVHESVHGLLGYRPEDLVGRSAYVFHNPLDADKMVECHNNLIRRAHCITRYYRFLDKAGTWRWLQTKATVVFEGGGRKGGQRRPQYVYCINWIISDEEGGHALRLEQEEAGPLAYDGHATVVESPQPAGQTHPNNQSDTSSSYSITNPSDNSKNTPEKFRDTDRNNISNCPPVAPVHSVHTNLGDNGTLGCLNDIKYDWTNTCYENRQGTTNTNVDCSLNFNDALRNGAPINLNQRVNFTNDLDEINRELGAINQPPRYYTNNLEHLDPCYLKGTSVVDPPLKGLFPDTGCSWGHGAQDEAALIMDATIESITPISSIMGDSRQRNQSCSSLSSMSLASSDGATTTSSSIDHQQPNASSMSSADFQQLTFEDMLSMESDICDMTLEFTSQLNSSMNDKPLISGIDVNDESLTPDTMSPLDVLDIAASNDSLSANNMVPLPLDKHHNKTISLSTDGENQYDSSPMNESPFDFEDIEPTLDCSDTWFNFGDIDCCLEEDIPCEIDETIFEQAEALNEQSLSPNPSHIDKVPPLTHKHFKDVMSAPSVKAVKETQELMKTHYCKHGHQGVRSGRISKARRSLDSTSSEFSPTTLAERVKLRSRRSASGGVAGDHDVTAEPMTSKDDKKPKNGSQLNPQKTNPHKSHRRGRRSAHSAHSNPAQKKPAIAQRQAWRVRKTPKLDISCNSLEDILSDDSILIEDTVFNSDDGFSLSESDNLFSSWKSPTGVNLAKSVDRFSTLNCDDIGISSSNQELDNDTASYKSEHSSDSSDDLLRSALESSNIPCEVLLQESGVDLVNNCGGGTAIAKENIACKGINQRRHYLSRYLSDRERQRPRNKQMDRSIDIYEEHSYSCAPTLRTLLTCGTHPNFRQQSGDVQSRMEEALRGIL